MSKRFEQIASLTQLSRYNKEPGLSKFETFVEYDKKKNWGLPSGSIQLCVPFENKVDSYSRDAASTRQITTQQKTSRQIKFCPITTCETSKKNPEKTATKIWLNLT